MLVVTAERVVKAACYIRNASRVKFSISALFQLYFLDPSTSNYEPLSDRTFQDINAGLVRL